MKKVKFQKEPGYIYDLFALFAIYFNKKVMISQVVNQNKSEEDTQYFDKLIDDFLPISDELKLFFYLNERNRMFMTIWYFEPYVDDFINGKYNLSVVLGALAEYDQVIENVIRFYFRDITEETLGECKESLPCLNRLIKESKYSSDIKSELYSFFIDPIPVIQKLIYELMAKEILLAQKYEKGYREILAAQAVFDCDKLVRGIEERHKQPIDLEKFDDIYVSFCYHYKNIIFWKLYDKAALFAVGIDYVDYMEFLTTYNELPELDVFGSAVLEKQSENIEIDASEKRNHYKRHRAGFGIYSDECVLSSCANVEYRNVENQKSGKNDIISH